MKNFHFTKCSVAVVFTSHKSCSTTFLRNYSKACRRQTANGRADQSELAKVLWISLEYVNEVAELVGDQDMLAYDSEEPGIGPAGTCVLDLAQKLDSVFNRKHHNGTKTVIISVADIERFPIFGQCNFSSILSIVVGGTIHSV